MGQTLPHGVYLPDEGERNCYSGLAANWQLLDGAVGTVAEHTSALAGKAPLVHTHSKSDITDFPVYGNTAGTICEGNDSRLSDARTPVAHTHTKSDVTDLFNSANTWSGDQTFTDINRQFPSAEKGVTPSSNSNRYEYINDKNGVNFGYCQFSYNTAGNLAYSLRLENLYDSNNQLSPNGSAKYAYTALVVMPDGTPYYRIYANTIPNNTNRFDLGNSSNQWNNLYAKKVNTQSVNGINPGALSLPDIYNSYDVITTNWSTAYNQPNDLKINGATPSYPGWLFIRLDNCTAADDFVIVRYLHVNAANLTFFGSFIPTASSYVLSVPIQAGITTKVWVSKIPTTCKYYACLGTIK